MIGGGCYGTFYASQLAKAKARGKIDYRRVLVVDKDPSCQARELGEAPDREFVVSDWTAFFDEWLAHAPRTTHHVPRTTHQAVDDSIVPSPHMPHLMFEWVLRRARARWPDRPISVAPVPGRLAVPYDRVSDGADATRYVSFADWICPTHCIEPAQCPAIGAPRTWEMSEAIQELAARLRAEGRPVAGPALFVCRHRTFGVGMFSAEEVRAGDRLIEDAGQRPGAEVLVGTISSCHGALNLITL